MREGERGVQSLRDMPSWFCSLPDQSPGQGLGVEPMMGELGMVGVGAAYIGEDLVTDLPAKQTALEGEGVAANAAFLLQRLPRLPSLPALLWFCQVWWKQL